MLVLQLTEYNESTEGTGTIWTYLIYILFKKHLPGKGNFKYIIKQKQVD